MNRTSLLKSSSANNTVSSIKNAFACEVTVLSASGTALSSTAKAGTGCTVVQYDTDGSTVLNKVTVVVPPYIYVLFKKVPKLIYVTRPIS